MAKLAEYPFFYYGTNLIVKNDIEYLTIYFRYRSQNAIGMGKIELISSHLSYVYKQISPSHAIYYNHNIQNNNPFEVKQFSTKFGIIEVNSHGHMYKRSP